ncbi:MAG: 23S rRNA (guanosine(2251)-2'-O)-methyltransferase RlmB [bacterium]
MSQIIYGRNSVLEALKAGKSIQKIVIARHAQGVQIQEIISMAKKVRLPVEFVSKEELFKMSANQKSQGVVAISTARDYATIGDIFEKSARLREPPILALLDGIEDPHNLGAIIRTADGAGLHGIVIPKRRSAGVTPTVVKTSAGATAHVLTVQVSNLNYLIDELKSKNIWIVGADQEADVDYYEADLVGALAMVIGSEGKGLHRLVKSNCDLLVKIPMFGKVNSLNASVAAALLFFEARKQREGLLTAKN